MRSWSDAGSRSSCVRFPKKGSGEHHNPLLGTRETTITHRPEPIATGTRVTVRDEGFIGRSEAAYGNAEHWERGLGWFGNAVVTQLDAPKLLKF